MENNMQTRFEGENLAALYAAIAKAQANCEHVIKDATSGAFNGSKYATLDNVVKAVIPSFNAQDLAIIQSATSSNGEIAVETIIAHKDGGRFHSNLSMKPTKSDPQGFGSAITYARRYALMAVAGVAPEDDDGNAASASAKPAPANNGKATPATRETKIYSPTAHNLQDGIRLLKTVSAVVEWWNTNEAVLKANTHHDSIADSALAHCKDLISGLEDVDMVVGDKNFNEEALKSIPFGEDVMEAYRAQYKAVKVAA